MSQPVLFAGPYASSSATFDPTRKYRWTLTLELSDSKTRVAFIGLNPSTADEHVDDPTVVRCARRAQALGFGEYTMLNIFAFRSTDPKGLKLVADPVGDGNDQAILGVVEAVDVVVLAGAITATT